MKSVKNSASNLTRGTHLSFLRIVALTLPIALGFISTGAALGIYIVTSGIPWYWAPLSSLIIYAGSVEFLIMGFIVMGTPLITIIWTVFLVNFRHVFYLMSSPYQRMRTPFQRFYGIFALTDEAYALMAVAPATHLNARSLIILQLLIHLWWVTGTTLGATLGTWIPPEIKGFDFALTSLFAGLALGALSNAQEPKLIIFATLAIGAAFFSEYYWIKDSFLITGILVYLVFMVFAYVSATRKPKQKHRIKTKNSAFSKKNTPNNVSAPRKH